MKIEIEYKSEGNYWEVITTKTEKFTNLEEAIKKNLWQGLNSDCEVNINVKKGV